MNIELLGNTWLRFKQIHSCSIDRMLCSPKLRGDFIALAKKSVDCTDEEQLLWTLVSLRKNKKLSRN